MPQSSLTEAEFASSIGILLQLTVKSSGMTKVGGSSSTVISWDNVIEFSHSSVAVHVLIII